MINDFISKVADLFSSEIRFSFVLPMLAAIFSFFMYAGFAFDFDFVFTLVFAWSESPTKSAFMGVAFVLFVFLFSYFLYGINNLMLRFWSGEMFFFDFFSFLNQLRHKYIRAKLLQETGGSKGNYWAELIIYFRVSVQAARGRNVNTEELSDFGYFLLKLRTDFLRFEQNEMDGRKKIDSLVRAFAKYNESSTAGLYGYIKSFLMERSAKFEQNRQWALFRLDQNYGQVVKGTSLGNIIEAYNEYSYKRYGIASQIFWPRIQEVISDNYKEYLKAQKSQLDFFITSASLSLLLLVSNFATPFVIGNWKLFYTYGGVHLVLTFLLYRATVNAASAYGNAVRSCYDLFRFKLIEQLALVRPNSSEEELKTWTSFSQLVAFSQHQNITFAPKSTGDEDS